MPARVGRAAPSWPPPAAWLALVAGVVVWGQVQLDRGTPLFLEAPPLLGTFRLGVEPGLVAAVVVGGVLAYAAPRLARRLSWRALLGASALAAAAWSLALALASGPDGITGPVETRHEYLAVLPQIGSVGDFLSTFTARIDAYPTHVRSHPPGMALLVYGLDRAGLGGPAPVATLIVVAAATTPAAALLALRSVAGAAAARAAAPFLVLAPAAVWIATSADALFMAIGAWAVALVVLAIGAEGRRSDLLALGGGLLFGVTCFLSFGLPLLALIPLAVAARARRVRPLALAAIGGAPIALAFLAAGYWWIDGFAAAREQYWAGVATSRPYGYFLVNNLAAFALATGPALALALARLRDRNVLLLAGAALAGVALADLSGMSKGEVERIWLPFLPWVMVACAALAGREREERGWLAAQVACAIAIQVAVATVW